MFLNHSRDELSESYFSHSREGLRSSSEPVETREEYNPYLITMAFWWFVMCPYAIHRDFQAHVWNKTGTESRNGKWKRKIEGENLLIYYDMRQMKNMCIQQ